MVVAALHQQQQETGRAFDEPGADQSITFAETKHYGSGKHLHQTVADAMGVWSREPNDYFIFNY
jgi:hypothetical protein